MLHMWLKPFQHQALYPTDTEAKKEGTDTSSLSFSSARTRSTKRSMRRSYRVCQHCRASWIWEDRLVSKPQRTCNQCGNAWQQDRLPDLRRSHGRHGTSPKQVPTGPRKPSRKLYLIHLQGSKGVERGKQKKART